jgi:hypothetical protein
MGMKKQPEPNQSQFFTLIFTQKIPLGFSLYFSELFQQLKVLLKK